jgi:hypothetical protein
VRNEVGSDLERLYGEAAAPWIDLDNDTNLDLVIANGAIP